MPSEPRLPITPLITPQNLEQLERVVEQHGGGRNAAQVDLLEQELSRARVVAPEALPPDVVTLHSHVVFEDEETGARREVTLCLPQEVKGGEGRVSVLAPVGAALLGLSPGQAIAWPVPGGRTRRLRIVAVPYQPEAAGDVRPRASGAAAPALGAALA
jgi:regulator of nucleoside diphosphate kinase